MALYIYTMHMDPIHPPLPPSHPVILPMPVCILTACAFHPVWQTHATSILLSLIKETMHLRSRCWRPLVAAWHGVSVWWFKWTMSPISSCIWTLGLVPSPRSCLGEIMGVEVCWRKSITGGGFWVNSLATFLVFTLPPMGRVEMWILSCPLLLPCFSCHYVHLVLWIISQNKLFLQVPLAMLFCQRNKKVTSSVSICCQWRI